MNQTVKKAKLTTWGNSQGVRIPRDLLREIGITDTHNVELDLVVRDGQICISPTLTPYQRLMQKAGPDAKLPDSSRSFVWERNDEEERILDNKGCLYPE